MSGLSLKESLFLGFCAVFIVFSRATLRLHLQLPGHAMFFMIFFLMMARGCIRHGLAATLTGFLAGIAALMLGLGKSGPLILANFLLPALSVDAGAGLVSGMFESYFWCGIVAAVASSTKFLVTYAVDLLVGMDRTVILQHASWEAGTALIFGVAGSLFVPVVLRKLKSYGIV